MKTMQKHPTQLERFRWELYQNFNKRTDTLIELIDALSSNTTAQSVVELSLSPHFNRHYSALYQAIREVEIKDDDLRKYGQAYWPTPKKRSYRLIVTDVTAQKRQFADTLTEKEVVYYPNAVCGNAPITIGHQYSLVSILPEREMSVAGRWVIPVSMERVKPGEDKELTGVAQVKTILDDEKSPLSGELVVEVADSSYSKPECLWQKRSYPNLVTITRLRSNRVLYQRANCQEIFTSGGGRQQWYGTRFALSESESWHEPDETTTTTFTSSQGKTYQVQIQAWHNMLMPGKNKPYRMRLEFCPFTLVRIQLCYADGTPVAKRPWWLIVAGTRRHELSLVDIYHSFSQRSDVEHFFRFGKQRLLLDSFQTPHTEREETWWQLVCLAYLQLWLAKPLAQSLPRPWQRYLPSAKKGVELTPSLVQLDLSRIIRQLDSPAQPPQPRNKGKGRPIGYRLPPRPYQLVLFKGQKPP